MTWQKRAAVPFLVLFFSLRIPVGSSFFLACHRRLYSILHTHRQAEESKAFFRLEERGAFTDKEK